MSKLVSNPYHPFYCTLNVNLIYNQIYTNAVFYETLRLYTVIPRAARVAARDTVLEAHKFKSTANGDIRDAEKFTVHIKQGSSIIIDIAATHLNRKTSSKERLFPVF